MTTSTMDLDRVLKGALIERAAGPTVGLLDEILRTAEATPQTGGRRTSFGTRQLALLAAAALLLAGLAGAAAIGSGLIEFPDPPPVPDLDQPGNGQLLTSFGYIDMAYAPDGQELAFTNDYNLYVGERLSDPQRETFPCSACSVAWDPTARRRLAVGNDEGLRLLDAATGEWAMVLEISPSAADVDGVTWSPDGEWIAFRQRAHEGRLMQIHPDGSGLAEVIPSEFADEVNGGETFVSPAWSPDGSAIAYLAMAHFPAGSNTYHEVDVVILTVASGGRHTVARLGQCLCLNLWPGLTWSPDGTQLAVTGPAPGDRIANTFGVFGIDIDTGEVEFLNANGDGRPAWQPIP